MVEVPFSRLTEDEARAYLERLRWPHGVQCPKCRLWDVTRLKGRTGLFQCRHCRKQFTVTVGTIFEGSHIPLSKWVAAFHLLCASKKGMSSAQLSRMLGITYKCAWHHDPSDSLRHARQEPHALTGCGGGR